MDVSEFAVNLRFNSCSRSLRSVSRRCFFCCHVCNAAYFIQKYTKKLVVTSKRGNHSKNQHGFLKYFNWTITCKWRISYFNWSTRIFALGRSTAGTLNTKTSKRSQFLQEKYGIIQYRCIDLLNWIMNQRSNVQHTRWPLQYSVKYYFPLLTCRHWYCLIVENNFEYPESVDSFRNKDSPSLGF